MKEIFGGKIEDVYTKIENDKNITKGEYVIVLEKQNVLKEKKEQISLEALIVDTMVKENCSSKEAINILKVRCKELKKNELYDASLNLKEIF